MRIVLFRHGIAEDRTTFSSTGLPDSERPLTERGVARTRQAAAGLVSLAPDIDLIGTSPYLRARGTAELIAQACGEAGRKPEQIVLDDLQPAGSAARIRRWLAQYPTAGSIALVGHEPDLSELAAWFTTDGCAGFARFKKAGACLIEFSAAASRGQGELQWLMTPGVLRRLGS